MEGTRAPHKQLDELDPSKRAKATLHQVLDANELGEDVVIYDEKLKRRQAERIAEIERQKQAAEEELVEVDAALHGERVLEQKSERTNARVLVLTKDVGTLIDGSVSQKRILEYAAIFEEVHVITMCLRGESANEPVRIAGRIWVYPTNSTKGWRMAFDAYRMVKEQLVFHGGFRADLIIAEDPFEAGIVGRHFAKKFDRTFQVHVYEDYFDPNYRNVDPYVDVRMMLTPFVMHSADCIRTSTESLKTGVMKAYPRQKEIIEALPVYYNLKAWQEADPVFDLHTKYPQFNFILLHITSMERSSHTMEVIEGIYHVLRQNRTVGLVIVGDGPLRVDIEKLVEAREIRPQVQFEPKSDDIVSHMKTANVLIQVSENVEEDYLILCGASVGIPMVLSEKGIGPALFKNGEDAFLCPVDSPVCIGEKVNTLLNRNEIRTRFVRYAKEMVQDRIVQDRATYLHHFKDSVERCLIGQS